MTTREELVTRAQQHLGPALQKVNDGATVEDLTTDEVAAMAYWHVINNDL